MSDNCENCKHCEVYLEWGTLPHWWCLINRRSVEENFFCDNYEKGEPVVRDTDEYRKI